MDLSLEITLRHAIHGAVSLGLEGDPASHRPPPCAPSIPALRAAVPPPPGFWGAAVAAQRELIAPQDGLSAICPKDCAATRRRGNRRPWASLVAAAVSPRLTQVKAADVA